MALPLSKAFTARAIATMWDNYQESRGTAPYLGRSLFGTTKKMGLTLKYITGQHGLPVALKGAAFDAKAPLRDGIGFATIENEMPFFRESYMVTEKEEQEYMQYINAENPALAQQVLGEIMKSPRDLILGADVVPERMIWQLIAPADGIPRILVTLDGGSTYYIDYTADSGVAYKAKHYSAIAATNDKWNAPATATPIADIAEFQETVTTGTGRTIGTIIMNTATWAAFCNAEDTKKQVQGILAYQNGIYLNKADVRRYLADNFGIEVLVYDKVYRNEAGNTVPFIPDGVVSCITRGVGSLGTVTYGTTPEERSGNKSIGELALVNTGVSVYTYTTPHPVNTHCVVSEIVLPSYEGMDDVSIMKVW